MTNLKKIYLRFVSSFFFCLSEKGIYVIHRTHPPDEQALKNFSLIYKKWLTYKLCDISFFCVRVKDNMEKCFKFKCIFEHVSTSHNKISGTIVFLKPELKLYLLDTFFIDTYKIGNLTFLTWPRPDLTASHYHVNMFQITKCRYCLFWPDLWCHRWPRAQQN